MVVGFTCYDSLLAEDFVALATAAVEALSLKEVVLFEIMLCCSLF